MAGPDLTPEGLSEARRSLREVQAERLTQSAAAKLNQGQGKLAQTLAHLQPYKNFEPTDNPEIVRREGFKYERMWEERRIELAEKLVIRTDPGPLEDANYLGMLAYQAASIELGWICFVPADKADLGWGQFLLGTVHSPDLNAFAERYSSHDYTIVAIYSALIDFIYQAAKATIEAQKPSMASDDKALVTIDTSDGRLESNLAKDSGPVDRLYKTLEAYFYSGYPRAFANETVPVENMLPLRLLINMAERWIIGHEFGHGLAGRIDMSQSPNPEMAEEYFADVQATILSVMSATALDTVEPEFALSGGAFALAALEVFGQALSIVHHGKVIPRQSDGVHPSNEQRLELILHTFETYFNHVPRTQLEFVLERPEGWRPEQTEAVKVRRQRVLYSPNTLFAIWDLARPRLLKDFDDKRALHPMWKI